MPIEPSTKTTEKIVFPKLDLCVCFCHVNLYMINILAKDLQVQAYLVVILQLDNSKMNQSVVVSSCIWRCVSCVYLKLNYQYSKNHFQGEMSKTIVLRTKPDTVLEGEEQFHISLITADNSADISHSEGDASIIILPNPGASGMVQILPEYRYIYIGEPGESSPSYDGKVEIVLTRGLGIYGAIAVTWSVTPRNLTAFLQVEGIAYFADLQQKTVITLQVNIIQKCIDYLFI